MLDEDPEEELRLWVARELGCLREYRRGEPDAIADVDEDYLFYFTLLNRPLFKRRVAVTNL